MHRPPVRHALILLCAIPLFAHADASSLAGTYARSSRDASTTVVVKPLDAGHARVSIDVGSAGCAGQVSGTGAVDGNTIHMSVPSAMASDGACRIDLTFSGARIRISEDSCLEFHGASCDFTETGARVFHKKR